MKSLYFYILKIYMEVKEFPITDEVFSKFRRSRPKPNDCVINALELLGILDANSADISRIFIGDKVVLQDQIEKVFETVFKDKKWHFQNIDVNALEAYLRDSLKPGHVVFCGKVRYQGPGHAFLIWKKHDGNIIMVDPQMTNIFCDLSHKDCFNQMNIDVLLYKILKCSKLGSMSKRLFPKKIKSIKETKSKTKKSKMVTTEQQKRSKLIFTKRKATQNTPYRLSTIQTNQLMDIDDSN